MFYENEEVRNYDDLIRLLLLEVQKKGWSMKEFATKMGKTPTWATSLFKGKKYPDGRKKKTELALSIFLEISDLLGIPPDKLLRDGLQQQDPPQFPIFNFSDFIREICRDEIKKTQQGG